MLSKTKLNTLRYWAHAGASNSLQAQSYKKQFPNRLDPYYKVCNALEDIKAPPPLPMSISSKDSVGKDERYGTWYGCPSCAVADIALDWER